MANEIQVGELKNSGWKDDASKSRLDLIPWGVMHDVADVMAFGAAKYGDTNWHNGMSWRRLIAAALRHFFAWQGGIDIDPDTGKSHLAHCVCCLMFLLTYEKYKLGTDDRKKW